MSSRFCAFAALAGSLALAAPAAADENGAFHAFGLGVKSAGSKQAPIYFGGPVISGVKLAVVIWGSGVAKITDTRIGPFASAIVNSSYLDQLSQYGTELKAAGGRQGTAQTIGRGSYLGKFRISPAEKSKAVTDVDIQAELQAQISSGALPPQDPDTLYMVYFPQGIAITVGGLNACAQFGAYHAALPPRLSPTDVFYAAVPDCGGGFNAITLAASHVLAGAVTDPVPTSGAHPAYPQGWTTTTGNELTDLCTGDETTLTAAGRTYVVAQVFDAKTNACATGKFASP